MKKKNVKVLFKTFAWLIISPFYELKMYFVERSFMGCFGGSFLYSDGDGFFFFEGEYFSIDIQ